MKLYLVRHGEALEKLVDPARPLSPKGCKDTARVADFLSAADVTVNAVYNSGKTRAVQTAEILAKTVLPDGEPETIAGLKPLDDPRKIQSAADGWSQDTMLVGHLPHLSVLTSLLVTGNPDRATAAFEASTMVCLQKYSPGQWIIDCVVPPAMVASSDGCRPSGTAD